MSGNIPCLSFVGFHNSGKTTLLRTISRILKDKGIRIGIVKSTKHSLLELESGNTDSGKFKRDGLFPHAIVAKDGVSIFLEKEADYLEKIGQIFQVEAMLLEGFKFIDHIPKIEVHRKGISEGYLFHKIANVRALVTDEEAPAFNPSFSFDEVDKIADFCLKILGK
ncbi:Molybdopterin-guanine dinucleotide biosynthesis protein MobB [Dissulfuribacter thermophilus]|uniref:Molybdopterin-guanine dinucleotide biosynthesis protein MobB n=1 Tax=Dissulfuribacter thermophilus TaxID=1156395 RepID=A0A1B9F8W8_9BACT|nr:molybdopterin-guanine dinucleotide biosynthesis protein MobB [Dissulfuribacter thermophilus]OCC16362.1 Molybdopterin-guanine dinucleotide biosynthesis protein MobB [Dissulfuribacter thermophilus]